MKSKYYAGLDFGSSGARISIINSQKNLLHTDSTVYKFGFKNPKSWLIACEQLLSNPPDEIRINLSRISISGTSGTLLACSLQGKEFGDSIPYNQICNVDKEMLDSIAGDINYLRSPFSGLSKALMLINIYGDKVLLRHQADWITGWFLNKWDFGEEGNNIKLGWNVEKGCWPKTYNSLPWKTSLPLIVKSGKIIGKINNNLAKRFNINKELLIISGTTDSNASYLAAEVNKEEGLAVLGTTIVLKKYIQKPIQLNGITNHKVKGDWILGGASNAGCGVLSQFFSDSEIKELSRQINPSKETGFRYLPLNCKGERFPFDKPDLEPILTPRPVSDSLFLHALFEGLAMIELKGWERFKKLTGTFPRKIITVGGGAKNPQWRSIRQRTIKIPIVSSNKTTSYGTALLALSSVNSSHSRFSNINFSN